MLLCVSASHQTATFELLEQLSTPSTTVERELIDGQPGVRGAVVLATCNRFEAYLDVTPDGDAQRPLSTTLDVIAAATGADRTALEGSVRTTQGAGVAEHLFSVAAGLKSVVVGEGEIGGQVRRALSEAQERGTTSRDLERLFQRATEAQRGVKKATAIGRAGRSLVRLALELADSRITNWARTSILLVGTGSYAAVTLAALRDLGASDIAVHSPSGRGAKFAAKHGLRLVTADTLAALASESDVVITCTSAEHPVVTADTLAGVSTPTMVIDLGMPRNVHPNVSGVAGVTLLDLETISLHAPLEELQATEAARAIVQDAAAKFDRVGREREAQAAIVALRSHIFELTEREVERARGRGEAEQVEQAMRHLVGVLLHEPTSRARQLAASGRADEVFGALETLFGIEAGQVRAAASPPTECPMHTAS